MTGLRAGQVELALQVSECDIEIDHRHLGGSMPEQFHQCGKINTTPKHLGGVSVAKLMWHDTAGNTGCGRNFVEIRAELTDQHLSGNRPCQQTAVRR